MATEVATSKMFLITLVSVLLIQLSSGKKVESEVSFGDTHLCVVTPYIDRHIERNAMDAAIAAPVLGWHMSPACSKLQSGYRVVITKADGGSKWEGLRVSSNLSDSIPLQLWSTKNAPVLLSAMSYVVQVGIDFVGEEQTIITWSVTSRFLTALSSTQLVSETPMWTPNKTAMYTMFRRDLKDWSSKNTYLAITGKPSPDWHMPHGRNTSHLLGAYKLWFNEVPLGVGPGRIVGDNIAVDSFNLTALMRNDGEANVIAIESYYQQNPKPGGATVDDSGGVVALIHDGNGKFLSGGASAWKSFDATNAFAPSFGTNGDGAGTGSYVQPHENIDSKLYPHGWRSRRFIAEKWAAPSTRQIFANGLAPKQALPVALRNIKAASFQTLSSSQSSHHYVIDFGANIQGHVNISFVSGVIGQNVIVRLGEQREANGSVKFHMESNNEYSDTWVLQGGTLETFVPHEYCEFRWAEIIGAPEPPTHALVGGWQVHYPFDGELNENGLVTQPPNTAQPMGETSGLTFISTNDVTLNRVWGLVQHTVIAASLDLNTDSNTRQRDLCTLDAFVATKYQAGVAPATSNHLRRRMVQIMWEPNGYVNFWTEFLISHVAALHAYSFDYADTTLASNVWDNTVPQSFTSHTALSWGRDDYGLGTYFNSSDNLVHATPKPLIDWPRSDILDTNSATAHKCDVLCVQMNAYAVLTHSWLSGLATRMGMSDVATKYQSTSEKIRESAQKSFSTSVCQVDPNQTEFNKITAADLLCYTDNHDSDDMTTATATALAAFAGLPGSAQGVLDLVPFLNARNTRRGLGLEVSGWMAGFMLEGIYTAAGEVEEGVLPVNKVKAAVDYAYSVLTNTGNNSWVGMLRQNATMTMESWTQTPFVAGGGGTFSHPWTASPAFVIPRMLIGVRPIEDGWRRVCVKPLPPSSLQSASIVVPTHRGKIELDFDINLAARSVTANITIPGNTLAQVCLPRYLFDVDQCTLTVNGNSAAVQAGSGALTCVKDDVGPGKYVVVMHCSE